VLTEVSDEYVVSTAGNIAIAVASLPLYVIFATICHRLVLLGDSAIPNPWGLFWSERETRFAGWSLIIGLLYFALSLPVMIIMQVFPKSGFGLNLTWLATYSSYIFVAYFEGRFSLVLPATAIGKQLDLKGSWALSHTKGMVIAFALVIPALVLDITDYFVVSRLLNGNALYADLVWWLLTFPVLAVEVAVISIAYSKLIAANPP